MEKMRMSFHSMKGRAYRRPTVSKLFAGSVLSLLLFSQPGFAEPDHGTRHVDAHVHGAAELAIALDGGQLVAEFTSPGMNLVGFEHQADNPSDVAAVEAAVQQLRLGVDLIEFEGGGCTLRKAEVKAEGLLVDDHSADHHEDEEAHAEFEANYVFNCTDANLLTSISVSFFTIWPGVEEIETVFLSADHQLSVELTASEPSFEIK
jgi:Protein of unknown function (DUF2796)